jgi:peptide/nickel transport system permease protein
MSRFLIRRIVLGLITLWVVVTLVFLLYHTGVGGDPARLIAGRQATPETLAAVRRSLGLDQPLWVQYWKYIGWPDGLLHGNLGFSFKGQEPVINLIKNAVPVDISLAVGASVIWVGLGISVGILAARHPRSIVDRLATAFVLTGISMPTFILGLLLIYVFFYLLTLAGFAIFPGPGTYMPFTQNPLEWARDLILPWVTLALISAATYSRLSRSSLLETLGQDYIRTARAKGLTEGRIVYRHALRSALTPLVTQFGIDVATVLGGAILTETVFGLPGLGRLAVLSIQGQDQPTVIAIVIFASAFIIVANIIVDSFYAILDPRVRLA